MEANKTYIGIDIGGTKTAVCAGDLSGKLLKKKSFPTDPRPETALGNIIGETEALIAEFSGDAFSAIGISCGGPLDSEKGIILSPPNLKGWDNVAIKKCWKKNLAYPLIWKMTRTPVPLRSGITGQGEAARIWFSLLSAPV